MHLSYIYICIKHKGEGGNLKLFCLCFSPQIFAIQLLSYLCTQYALPKSLSVARLAISVMGTLLTGLQTSYLFASYDHTFCFQLTTYCSVASQSLDIFQNIQICCDIILVLDCHHQVFRHQCSLLS